MPKGIAASPGITMGKVYILEKETFCILEYKIKKEEVEKEIKRFKEAVKEAKEQLQEIEKKAREKIGIKESYIFRAHLSILEDPLLIKGTLNRIRRQKLNEIGRAHV